MNANHILIVGAGIFGASAALELRRRGHTVTLVDPGPLPHPEASSTDVSKIVRADYGGDSFYSRFALDCIPEWHRWNSQAGRKLYHETGFLLLAGERMRAGGFEHDSREVMKSLRLDVERMDGERLRSRFPAWTSDRYPDGYFNPRAGWVESADVVAWLLTLAREAGVVLREGQRMESLLEKGSRVAGIVTDRGVEHRAEIVVVAAGAWTPTLLPWMSDALQCVGQPVLHFRPDDAEPYRPDRFPPWAADIAKSGWYGFPTLPDGTMKVANHGAGIPVDPREERVLPAGTDERFSDFLADTFPDLAGSPIIGRRLCLYCDSWDGDFWIDWDPSREGFLVATGGSGHGFKFAPLIGAVISDRIEGKPNPWESRFRWRTLGERRTEAARMG
jgi:glycine/D-amino acid oxidase-like deaminating enzyme